MEKRALTLSAVLVMAAAAVFLFLDWRISVGLVVGLLCFRLYFMLLTEHIDSIIEAGKAKGTGVRLAPLLRLLVLALPLLAGAALPQFISIWGVFAGEMMFKLCTYGMMIFGKKEK